MHIRGWTILGISLCSFLLLLYAVRIIKRIHQRVERLDLTADKAAHAEAIAAHQRIDRIDHDQKADWAEMSALRAMINVVKAQVKFLLHKDISDELARQLEAEKGRKKDDDGN